MFNKKLKKEFRAVERLCEIYFIIASDAMGEDKVREKRDELINSMYAIKISMKEARSIMKNKEK